MNLVIISGREATAKTNVGQSIAKLLSYQYLSKDTIKEALFDSESHNTWDYSWYEKKAKTILFDSLNDFIARDKSVVIETNFISGDRQKLVELLKDDILVSEVYCTTKGLTSFKRFVKRNENGLRHKGHHDRRWYIKVLLQDLLGYIHVNWPHRPVRISDKVLVIDSTNVSKIDYKKIIDFIKQA